MKAIFFSLLVSICVLSSPLLRAESVLVHSGNVFLKSNNGKELQLTRTGHDSQPTLSENGKWVVFVREIPGKLDKRTPTVTEIFANELWLVSTDGKTANRLVEYGRLSSKSGAISAIGQPQFFPDNRRIAFTAAWSVVEGSVHIFDLKTKKIQFISAGNSVEVVPMGQYKNHLIVQRHKYFLPGGSYDWYWLLNTTGAEIGAIGDEENLKMFREMY